MLGNKTFGAFLRRKRVEAGVSLRELTTALGLKSAVYLAEIERGLRPPLHPKHWDKLIEVLPGLSKAELEEHADRTQALKQLNLQDAPINYQNLGLMFARRIQEKDLSRHEIEKLVEILGGADE